MQASVQLRTSSTVPPDHQGPASRWPVRTRSAPPHTRGAPHTQGRAVPTRVGSAPVEGDGKVRGHQMAELPASAVSTNVGLVEGPWAGLRAAPVQRCLADDITNSQGAADDPVPPVESSPRGHEQREHDKRNSVGEPPDKGCGVTADLCDGGPPARHDCPRVALLDGDGSRIPSRHQVGRQAVRMGAVARPATAAATTPAAPAATQRVLLGIAHAPSRGRSCCQDIHSHQSEPPEFPEAELAGDSRDRSTPVVDARQLAGGSCPSEPGPIARPCPILGAKRERRSIVSCGQTWSEDRKQGRFTRLTC